MNRQQAVVLRRLKAAFQDFQTKAQAILAELEGPEQPATAIPEAIARCMDLACQKYAISREDLLGRSRKGHVAWARHVAMYLAIKATRYKDLQVGHFFIRERSGVRHAVIAVRNRMSVDKAIRADVEDMLKKL